MPKSVPLANATTVLPRELCAAFTIDETYAVRVNEFKSGDSLRWPEEFSPRNRWTLKHRLTSDRMLALRDFYETTGAGPFHFYEPIAPFVWDPAGVDPTNRYTVRFDGKWSQSQGVGRGECSLALIQIAGTLPGAEILDFSDTAPGAFLGVI